MEITIIAIALGLIAAASWLALKVFTRATKTRPSLNLGGNFGDAAIQLLREMREAEHINEKSKRIPRTIELIEERDRLLDCIDEHKRQQLIEEYTDSCA